MRIILCRLAVWICFVLETCAFSTHLRQSNTSLDTEATPQLSLGLVPSSQSELALASILRIRASEYVQILRSTFGDREERTISTLRDWQHGFLRSRERTSHAISLYASSVFERLGTLARFVVAIALIACVLGVCILALPADEEKVLPRPLAELYETNYCCGTWARSYQNADAKDKEALEMLFRCHIIAAEEFRNSTINQPHIDECIWIGRRMLVDRSLEDWLDRCAEAQQQFEESLNACSEEKWKVRSDTQMTTPGRTAIDFTLGPHGTNVKRERDIALLASERTPSSPYPSNFFVKDTTPSNFRPEHAAILNSPDASHRLLLRCTEIMAEYDVEKRAARRFPPSDTDLASPVRTPPPTAGNLENAWTMPPRSSAPAGFYPQSARDGSNYRG